MEKKIAELFDDISLQEADELLYQKEKLFNKKTNTVPDQQTVERIIELTLRKTGVEEEANTGTKKAKELESIEKIKHPKYFYRLSFSKFFVVSAAAVLIAVAAFFTTGSDFALAAIQKLFHFIPGYGILEDDGRNASDHILYILDTPVSVENEKAILSLQNAVATKNTITVMLEMTDKEMAENLKGNKDKKEIEALFEKDASIPPVRLNAMGMTYENPMGSSSSGGDGRQWHTWLFNLEPEETMADETYILDYIDLGISVSFRLKHYDTFSSLDEIGATEVRNDISITAVAKEEEDGKLHVELYPINHQYDSSRPESLYVYSFMKDTEYGYQGDDLHLQTNNGKRAYEPLDSHMGPNTKFTFSLDPADEELFLKIPYILVQSREEKTVKLKVPKSGEKIVLNQRIEFEGSTLIIKSVERGKWQDGSEEHLKMEYGYENHIPGKILMDARVIEVGLFDEWIGGGGSWETDENGITARYWFLGEKEYGDTIKLKFQNPIYYLTDGYTLKLEPVSNE